MVDTEENQEGDVYKIFIGMSRRQLEVSAYVAVGCNNMEIAESLKLDCGTIKEYLFQAFSILDIKTRSELSRFVNDHVEDFVAAMCVKKAKKQKNTIDGINDD